MRTIELVPGQDLDSMMRKGEGFAPDFHVFTSGIESDRSNSRLVHMVGSSTERDMQKDSMSLYALNDMTKADSNMTIWLNHDYVLPDSIFGSVVGTPRIMHQDGVADLHLNVDVELSNPKAAQVKKYIDNGRKLGCSIGCMVTKYEVPDPSDGDGWQEMGINILGVYVVEYSVVGIPCNQRSWVENAIRGVFTRTYDPGLAPAMKSLWPSAYKQVVKGLSSEKRQELDELPSRSTPDARLEWHVPTKTFTMSHGGSRKSLTSDQVKTLFRGEIPASVREVDASQDYDENEDIELMKKTVSTEVDTKIAPPLDEVENAPALDVKKAAKKPAQQTEDPNNDDDAEDAADGGADDEEENADGTPKKKPAAKSDEAENTESIVEPDLVKEVPVVAEEVIPDVPEPIEVSDVDIAMLDAYNTIGKSLKLPAITKELFSKHLHPVVQEVEAALKAAGLGNPNVAQTIHDMVCGLGAACDNTQTVPQAVQQAQAQATQPSSMSTYNDLSQNVEILSKSIDAYSAFATDLSKAQKSHALTLKELEKARAEVGVVSAEIMKVQETINSLKNMPLGNPITHSRTVHAEDTTVTHDELLNIDGSKKSGSDNLCADSLSGAFALTSIKSEDRGGQFMRYREWPAGVGGSIEKGVRPELTSNQILFMDFNDIQAYRAGRAAQVPYIDNQVAPK